MVSLTRQVFGIIVIVAGLSLVLQFLATLKPSPRCPLTKQQQIPTGESGPARQSARFPAQIPDFASMPDIPILKTWRKRRLTIGIPTLKRRDGKYFPIMLDTMLNKTSPAQLNEIVFVVFLADKINTSWKQEMETYLKKKYHAHIEAGSLIVIQAPLSFYRTMPKSVHERKHYIDWRTKQNFDYAYLMKYSIHLSEYYMQMEDDVITKDDYYSAIVDYINKNRNETWACLEFSTLGFIGKLFRSSDVVRLAEMLLMFNSTMPVDYTIGHFIYLAGQQKRFLRKPTLFNHLGFNSSLAGKTMPADDMYYVYPNKELHGDNPQAKIYTSLKFNTDFPPESAYGKLPGYFWSITGPELNDYFSIVFNKPQLLKGVVIVTGMNTHPDDIFHSAVVEASSISSIDNACEIYNTIGSFHNGIANITETSFTANMSNNKTICLRMRATEPQYQWVIIKEIAVFVK